MNRKRMHTTVYLMPIVLVGLFLACGLGSPDADGETLSASTVSASQALPRDFALPLPLFASNSAWNQTASGATVLPASDQQITVIYRVLLGDTTDLHPSGPPPTTWPFPDVNYDDYAIPVFRAGAGQQDVTLCDYEGNPGASTPKLPTNPDGSVPIPAPAGTVRPAGPRDTDADGHLVLYDTGTFEEYDFWQATTVRDAPCQSRGGGLTGTVILEAGAIDFFDVRGAGTNPDTYSSARAVGTPLLAGLILPEDVESGAISHALAVAIPGLRNLSADPYEPLSSDYFYPASTTETDFYSTNAHALAAGQRIRLKSAIVDEACSQIDESQLAPITQMFLTALRDYGAYLVDNAGGFTFYAEDIHSANLDLTEAEIKTLIGASGLPPGKTKWQIAIEKLNEELERIPFACGPEFSDPAEATITTANFEMVEPATFPVTFTAVSTICLPLVLNNFAPPSSLTEPMSLADIAYWAYQIQDVSQTGMVDALVASDYDMLVLEPTRTDWSSDDKYFDTQGMVTRLKNSTASDGEHRKLILAYLDIGEAEDWRWYWTWSQDWDCIGDPPADWPDYILACDPDGWSGNYPVAYWDPLWKDIVISGTNQNSDPYGNYNSIIDEVIKDGFDGIYLDWVEAFECSDVVAAAQAAGKDPAGEMIAFIQEMRDYATARNPDFVIIQQNAASLIDGHPELTSTIDAIAQEAIWYDGEADVDWGDPDGYDWPNDSSLTDYYIGYLEEYLDAGLPVFDCEYALDYADTAYANSCSKGYVPYVTQRALSQLTTTPHTGCNSTPLAEVNDFLYQLQNLDLPAIGNTAYDLVVMDYAADGNDEAAFTAAQIAALKNSPGGAKIVLAYMSIGEAEDYRFYWQSGWTPGNPAWLDVENPDWEGNYKVHYWDPAWQTIIFSYTDRLLDAGFDGAYLDIIDAYEYYADQDRTTAAQEMADFVAAIRAHARASDPDFYIFPQNAPELASLVPDYLSSVDGIGQEDIYYGYENDNVKTPPAVTAGLEEYLDLFKNAGKLVLTVDYATTPSNVDDAYTQSQAQGYVPFVTMRDLDQLTINPDHEPD